MSGQMLTIPGEIVDDRANAKFKGITFSGFKRLDAKKQLMANIYARKFEPACFWAAEYICSGNYSDLIEHIFCYFANFIHTGNPKLVLFLNLRFQQFKEIATLEFKGNEMSMRNSSKIRRLFCEIICTLCESPQKHAIVEVKIPKNKLTMEYLTENLRAPHVDFASNIFVNGDNNDLFTFVNEFAYSLRTKIAVNATFWLEWFVAFDGICKSDKNPVKIANRKFVTVNVKYHNDVIWIIWDVFLAELAYRNNSAISEIVHAALDLFMFNYSATSAKKRKRFLYFVIDLFCEPLQMCQNPENTDKIASAMDNINCIYEQIKLHEHTSIDISYLQMDYNYGDDE